MWKKSEEDEMDVTNNVKPTARKTSSRSVSTIGSSAVINGEIKGNEDLLILGKFDGTINLDKNNVTVGKGGILKGKVQAQIIMVEGQVEGDLMAKEKIVLKKSAKVKANIITSRLVMDDGCHFQGGVDMSAIKSSSKPEGAPKHATPSIKPDDSNNKIINKI